MSTDIEIRTTLRQAAEATDAPAIDRAGFERRVRRHRLRRRAGGAAAAGAICAVALAVPLAVQQVGSESGTAPLPFPAAGPQERPPAYFVLGQRAVMLDPDGGLHDLGVRAEAVVGPTEQGVLIVSGESHLVHVRVAEADSGWTFDRVEVPTTEPVDSAAVSADGSQVAVIDNKDDLVVYDLADGDELSRTSHDRSAYVADFSDRVLYAVGDDTLRLGTGPDAVDLRASDGPAWNSVTGGDLVATTTEESNVTTRVYDVATGSAVEVAEMPGWGDLSPDGRYYLAALDEGSRELWDLEAGEERPLSGLEGSADQIRWLDEDTVLVGSGTLRNGDQVSLLYACEASTQHCVEIYETGKLIWLGH